MNRLPHLNKENIEYKPLCFPVKKLWGEKRLFFFFGKNPQEKTKISPNKREKEKGINSEMFIFAEEKQGRILEQQYIDPGCLERLKPVVDRFHEKLPEQYRVRYECVETKKREMDILRGILETVFHLYPVLPQKLHINVQQSHIGAKFYLFLRIGRVKKELYQGIGGIFPRNCFWWLLLGSEVKKALL